MDNMITISHPQNDDFNGGQSVTATTIVVCMTNGMIASSLFLPVAGLAAGWFTSIWTCLLVGYLLYYTAYLIIAHMGESKNMKECILAHFNYEYKYMSGYGIIIWISFVPILVLLFNMTCGQINALLGYQSNWVIAAVFILTCASAIASRMLHWAEQFMAIGIVGTVLFIIFIVWAIVSAPQGPKTVPVSGPPFTIIASLVTSLQIHDFLAQNIIKNPRKHEYKGIVVWTFIIGEVIYILSLLGSFAIVNRHPTVSQPQMISDYFPSSQWQAIVLNLSFIIVFVTMAPNFTIISNVRFFQIFKIDLGSKISLSEIIYIIVATSFACAVYVFGVQLQTVFVLNGSIIGYLYIILIPIWMHFKCVWVDRSSGTVEGDEQWNRGVKTNVCECKIHYRSKLTLYLETIMLVSLLIAGLVLIYQNLASLIG